MFQTTLPPELITAIGGETTDFAVQAKRVRPLSHFFPLFLFGIFWTGLSLLMVGMLVGPVIVGSETSMVINGKDTVVSAANIGELAFPIGFLGFFVAIGVMLIAIAFYTNLKAGGYFVGTPTRLVSFRKGVLRSIDWEQFSGDIESKGDAVSGDIIMTLRSGKMVSSKNSGSRYVADAVYIAGIPNPHVIAEQIRRRIKENDPTSNT